MRLDELIRDVPDFPKEGIVFKDITPLFASAGTMREMLSSLVEPWRGDAIDVVVAAEARGFLLGPAIAMELGAGFAPVRKPGKLPWKTRSETYELEYGTDTLCMHEDAVPKGARVLICDDLLATGGTVSAMVKMVRKLGGEVAGCSFIIELDFLKGREKLGGLRVESLVHCEGE